MNVAAADTFVASLGVEAYRVGGSVRDELMGRPAKDADYVVRGESLDALRDKLVRGGARIARLKLRDGQHVGWRATKKGVGCVEIVLPRTEISTGPGQGDFAIVPNSALTLEQDCVRRDFTFNALYRVVHHPEGLRNATTTENGTAVENILDPTGGGLYDLQHKIVRTTHEDSFRDDPLRILRALRFVSTLGYDLSTDTGWQMVHHAQAATGLTDKGVSGKAVDELFKLLMGADAAKALRLMRVNNVMAVFLPELAPMLGFDQGSRYHDLTTDEHTFKAIETACKVDAPLRVRVALLFHDAGKPEAAWIGEDGRKHYYAKGEKNDHEVVSDRLWREAAGRLNVDRKMRNDVSTLILNHMVTVKPRAIGVKVRRERVRLGDEMYRDLILMRMCDVSGKGARDMNSLRHLAKLEQERCAAERAGIPASVKDLKIDGRDVMHLPGPDRGRVLRAVLDEVVCNPTAVTLSKAWQQERARALA
jgi:tRNA nucleotidyltransferase/poly(A) polymerase